MLPSRKKSRTLVDPHTKAPLQVYVDADLGDRDVIIQKVIVGIS